MEQQGWFGYTISYDLGKNPVISNEEFRRNFIKFLLAQDSISLNSYNNSTIIFQNKRDLKGIGQQIEDNYGNMLRFQLTKIEKVNNPEPGFDLYVHFNKDHFQKFRDLVEEVKVELQ